MLIGADEYYIHLRIFLIKIIKLDLYYDIRMYMKIRWMHQEIK